MPWRDNGFTVSRFSLACIGWLAITSIQAAEPVNPGPVPPPATELGGINPERDAEAKKAKDHLGLLFESADGRFRVNPWLRGQFRYTNPLDGDLLNVQQVDDLPGGDFEIRRARLKMEGHLFSPRIGFYFEHELSGDHPLLDLRLDLQIRENLLVRIGQYKVLYNRERVDSSGKQQFVERSISTYAFTLDRQIGATLAKHSLGGSRWDNWLMVGVHEGDGIDPDARGDDAMWLARWQWQFLGRDLPFSQSDIRIHEKPAATLAFAASRVRGPYTRFSSSGGGQLIGFEQGGDDRYTLEQWLQEFAFMHQGYSFQQEYHVKHIEDHKTGLRSELSGGYVQAGKAWELGWFDQGWVGELALRLARVDWDNTPIDRTQREYSVVANLFFAGHDNKLTLELSRLELHEADQPAVDENRLQLQWDISF